MTTGIGLISNIDDKLLGATRRHLRTDFDLVVTAQQVRSYKPDPAHFKECKRRIGTKTKWVHIATGLETDVIPCVKAKVPVIWVDRKKQGWPQGQRGKPTEIVKDLRSAVKLLGRGLARPYLGCLQGTNTPWTANSVFGVVAREAVGPSVEHLDLVQRPDRALAFLGGARHDRVEAGRH